MGRISASTSPYLSPTRTECAPTRSTVEVDLQDQIENHAKGVPSPITPILAAEPDLYPDDLLDTPRNELGQEARWWVMYCLSRQEKLLMRRLRASNVAHYCPLIAKRNRSPNGRMRTSHLPLFPGYAFVYGSDEDRYAAVATGCVSRCLDVSDGQLLRHDLQQIEKLIAAGAPLTPEARLLPGDRVRVASGPFRGFEGVIIRRQNEARLLVAVNYLQQGASMLLEDCQLESL